MDDQTIRWPVRALPKIILAGRFWLQKGEFPVVYRAEMVALHLHYYRARLRLGGREIALNPGDVTLTPPGMDSSYALAARGDHLCIHFTPCRGGKACRLPVHFSPGPRREYLAQRLGHVIALHRTVKAGAAEPGAILTATALQEFLLYLAHLGAHADPDGGRATAALDRARELMEAEYRRDLRIGGIAREVGLNPHYLARVFHRRHGMTIRSYLTHRRLDAARQLLANSTLSVKEVAAEVGIHDQHYFNKLFRRFFGQCPTRARLETRRPEPG